MRIVKVRFKTPEDFLENLRDEGAGALFCPSTTPGASGEQVLVDLKFPGLPNRVLVLGHVRWWRSAVPRLRVRAGCLVDFDASEEHKRDFLVSVANGEKKEIPKRRFVRLPVQMSVQWRLVHTLDFQEGRLKDISPGGAFLAADVELPVGTEVVLSLNVPGTQVPVTLAGRVAYSLAGKGSGIKFLYRDGGGARRIKEVIRRVQMEPLQNSV